MHIISVSEEWMWALGCNDYTSTLKVYWMKIVEDPGNFLLSSWEYKFSSWYTCKGKRINSDTIQLEQMSFTAESDESWFPYTPTPDLGLQIFCSFAIYRALFVHNAFLSSTLVVIKQQSWKHQKGFFLLCLSWRSCGKINRHTNMLPTVFEMVLLKVLSLFFSEH